MDFIEQKAKEVKKRILEKARKEMKESSWLPCSPLLREGGLDARSLLESHEARALFLQEMQSWLQEEFPEKVFVLRSLKQAPGFDVHQKWVSLELEDPRNSPLRFF